MKSIVPYCRLFIVFVKTIKHIYFHKIVNNRRAQLLELEKWDLLRQMDFGAQLEDFLS